MRKFASEEIIALLDALKKIVSKDAGEKEATRFENAVIKIAIKTHFQMENKNINSHDFKSIDGPLRESFEMLSKFYNNRRKLSPEARERIVLRAVQSLNAVARILEDLIRPFVKMKNLMLVSEVFDIVANVGFVTRVFSDPELEEELDALDDAMTNYTQFANVD